jgi:hypothetical protein
MPRQRTVSDSDAAVAADSELRLLTGRGHTPYHDTPPPVPHPPSGPRARRLVPTGGAVSGHRQ